MASAIFLRRATASTTLFSGLSNSTRSAFVAPSVSRFFNTDTQINNAAGNARGNVEIERRSSSDRGVARHRESAPPSVFPDVDLIDPFSPTRTLSQVMNLMDQFLDNTFFGTSRGGVGTPASRRGWDVKEDNENLYLRMDMPGLSKDDVNVLVEQNTLVIKGEGPKESEHESGRRYSSRLELPPHLYKIDEIKAEMKNGVLKLVVPKVKPEERKDVREVEVE